MLIKELKTEKSIAAFEVDHDITQGLFYWKYKMQYLEGIWEILLNIMGKAIIATIS